MHTTQAATAGTYSDVSVTPGYQAYLALYVGFIVAPIVAGADKFFGLLTNNLLMLGAYYDIALRDLGLAIGVFALGRLSEEYSK